MRVAILSDIHANYFALEAVREHALQKQRVECFWYLGDIVGYGPQPVECLDWLRSEVSNDHWVLGNHDAMLLGLDIRERWTEDADAQIRAKEKNRFAFQELAD